MAKRIKYLSSFEEDCVWMSYRYCIGRHSISSLHHATNLISIYNKLSSNRRSFMANDINKCIEFVLRGNLFSVRIISDTNNYCPLYLFYEFINQIHIKSYEELGKYKYVVLTYNNGDLSYNIEKRGEDDPIPYISQMDFEDLDRWQYLSSILNDEQHVFDDNMDECFVTYRKLSGIDKNYSGYIEYVKYNEKLKNVISDE